MKIGIFTITDALNYGAYYQMYALNKYLHSLDNTVITYNLPTAVSSRIKKYFTRRISLAWKKLILRTAFNQANQKIDIDIYNGQKLDLAILGSDEIWNIENNSFDHFPQYFGFTINAKKLISYAPSIGFANIDNPGFQKVTGGLKQWRDAKYLVRDSNTALMLEKHADLTSQIVCDPTILFNRWESLCTGDFSQYEKYIVFYGYKFDRDLAKQLRSFCDKNKFLLISSGYTNHKWCDLNLNLDPFKFLGLLQQSSGLVTNTFHGTVMASLLSVPLQSYASGQKVADFIKKAELSNNTIKERKLNEDLEEWFITDRTKTTIEQMCRESRDILSTILREA